MNGSHRIPARLFLVAAAAVLTLSMPVVAQIPGTARVPALSSPQQTAETRQPDDGTAARDQGDSSSRT